MELFSWYNCLFTVTLDDFVLEISVQHVISGQQHSTVLLKKFCEEGRDHGKCSVSHNIQRDTQTFWEVMGVLS